MRIAIHNYSQAVAAAMVDTVGDGDNSKQISIDATDLLILDWFTQFYPNMKKKIIDGKEYAWVKRSKVLEDLPILRITEKSVSERFKKLVHFKLLDYKVVFDKGKSCYFTHGESYPQLLVDFSTISDSQRAVNQPFKGRSTSLSKGGQTDNKDSNLDSPIKDNGFAKNGKNPSSPCPECGGKLFKNTQTGWIECSQCFERF